MTIYYPSWKQCYSGEDFDRIQAFAYELTDEERKVGLYCGAGYSETAIAQAKRAVKAAQTF
jgi:hypothetical protein